MHFRRIVFLFLKSCYFSCRKRQETLLNIHITPRNNSNSEGHALLRQKGDI